ncbi:hypothetical protein RB195_007387 [Necator americanus]|uniref:CUB domain-containing protein n=1 Tax=Necator americanus TaxID=51031 RepID=A0ABR1BX18_NECAM
MRREFLCVYHIVTDYICRVHPHCRRRRRRRRNSFVGGGGRRPCSHPWGYAPNSFAAETWDPSVGTFTTDSPDGGSDDCSQVFVMQEPRHVLYVNKADSLLVNADVRTYVRTADGPPSVCLGSVARLRGPHCRGLSAYHEWRGQHTDVRRIVARIGGVGEGGGGGGEGGGGEGGGGGGGERE